MLKITRMLIVKVFMPDEEIECFRIEEDKLLEFLELPEPYKCELVDTEIIDVEGEGHPYG